MGKLGHGNTQDYSEPTMIVSLLNYRIFDISCGSQHTITVGILREITKTKTNSDDIKTKDNYLFLFGDNTYGQIGLETEEYTDTPKLLDFFLAYKIKKIECGFYHNIILSGKTILNIQNVERFSLLEQIIIVKYFLYSTIKGSFLQFN